MANCKRTVQLKFRVTQEEQSLVDQRMKQAGTTNRAAYLRKVAIDGYILRLDMPELREILSLLRRCSGNLNQVAKRANETGRIYQADIEELHEQMQGMWEETKKILTALSELG